MLVNLYHDNQAEHRRLLVAGLVSIVSIALLIGLSIAIYDKRFTTSTTVTVMADKAGLQLARFGDVRVYGALVGQVRSIESDGEQAVITLALEPDAARNLPSDLDVRILPTTLFGQHYVELVPTAGSAAPPLRDGAVVTSDRVSTNVELQAILADLFPVLRSVQPAQLNATLFSLSRALQGNGAQIGDTLVDLNAYLKRITPELPTLQTDLRLLTDVAETYRLSAPDLIGVLRNATVTARTVTDLEGDLNRALTSITGLATISRTTLADNEELLIAQTRSGRPLLSLLDTYSPMLNCLLTGLDRQIPDTENVFQNDIIHQTLELGAPQRAAYTAADAPSYGEVGRGPWCLGLPDDYDNPAGFLPLNDGTDKDNPDGGLG
ncbi:virulence factor Mce family protein [Aeromicrobium marinum DSM 15272]|uniref:Virulence factor Mce family protein n=1 Tax=Aeromicrobium marinum DSM 15272 TaxID=585531 RepID=E2SEK0_9ACTN|nr:MCE family protein [Aeromicrobium marinum]EFQ82297.1 virulence factor Mce family protein [Aeromicrobium marinum DSM 15272]